MTCPANDQPRILILDCETKLIELYAFGIRDQFIDYKQIKDVKASGRNMHMVGLKWLGERKRNVLTEWDHGYRGMLQGVHDALSEADAVVTYNGARFDLPKLQGQFLLERMPPPKPPTQIDLFKTARKLGFVCSKLDYLAQLLEVGKKVKHPGLQMWIDVHNGCPKARKRMTKYCGGDLDLTEDVLNRLLPYIDSFPRLPGRHGDSCPNCGNGTLTSQGRKATRYYIVQSLKCNSCGAWSQGKREKIAA
jgi:hypothetical protein